MATTAMCRSAFAGRSRGTGTAGSEWSERYDRMEPLWSGASGAAISRTMGKCLALCPPSVLTHIDWGRPAFASCWHRGGLGFAQCPRSFSPREPRTQSPLPASGARWAGGPSLLLWLVQ